MDSPEEISERLGKILEDMYDFSVPQLAALREYLHNSYPVAALSMLASILCKEPKERKATAGRPSGRSTKTDLRDSKLYIRYLELREGDDLTSKKAIEQLTGEFNLSAKRIETVIALQRKTGLLDDERQLKRKKKRKN